jgi:hypothetical protein
MSVSVLPVATHCRVWEFLRIDSLSRGQIFCTVPAPRLDRSTEFPYRRVSGATIGVTRPGPRRSRARPSAPSASHPGVVMGLVWSSRSSKRLRRVGVPPTSSSWPRTCRSAWRPLVDWSAHPSEGNGPAGSSPRQPQPESGLRGMISAAGPGGGTALGAGASGTPPPSQGLSALPPAVTAHGPSPATRRQVVLLPHTGPSPLTSDPPTTAQEGLPA